jgi:DNA polymerase III subunit gamma/tau
VTLDALRQAWPNVVEAIKAKGRVAAIVIGNASVASFDEGVLTLRFPRQGDVKGFQGSKYEDLLKQAINAMFGVNVVIRAVTGGGDAPSPGRRQGPGPGPAPAAPPAQSPSGQPSASSHGQPPAGQPPADPPPPGYPPQNGQANHSGPGAAAAVTAGHAGGSAANGGGGGTNSFGSPVMSGGGDLPPLPQPPPPDDEDFDPDDEDMSSSTTVNDLTGMALVQRELGAQIIAEYDD